MNILVVDDDRNVGEFFRRQIGRGSNHTLNVCLDGSAACAALERWRPDLLVMDWLMPGKNGIDVLREIGANPGVLAPGYIVMITGAPDVELLSMIARELGANEVLEKPLSARTVTDIIQQAEQGISARV